MGRSFEELIYRGRMQPSTFGRPTRRMEEPESDTGQGLASKRGYEQAINQRLAKQELANAELIEKFGTADPDEIGSLKGTGLFTEKGIVPAGEIYQLMRLDPVGTKAAIDRAVAVSGMSGAQTLTGTPDTSQYYEGVGRSGERFLTNRGLDELSQPTPGDMDIREDVTDLKETNPLLMARGKKGKRETLEYGGALEKLRGAEVPRAAIREEFGGLPPGSPVEGGTFSMIGGGRKASPERMAFEGQLSQAIGIAGAPERGEAATLAKAKRLNEAIERASTTTDVTTELKKLEADLESGAMKALGIGVKEVASMQKDLARRAKNPREASAAVARGTPREYALPWTRSGKDGQAADPALPADMLNPGGGTPVITQAQQRQMLSANELDTLVRESVPNEIPRTNHYAKGGKSPAPRQTPGVLSPTTRVMGRPRGDEPNPVDLFLELLRPPKGLEPEEALMRRSRDPFQF